MENKIIKIILSTRNPSKAEQVKASFNDVENIIIQTLTEAGIEGEAIEDGISLEENAFKKAMYAYENSKEKCWTMADDTGLFIEALNGGPGIKAARWAGENATTSEITQYCLKQLEGKANRNAAFETVAALISPDRQKYFFTGKAEGVLLEQEKTKPQPKMPYSALFMPTGFNKVWADMTPEEENKISHRGKAFQKLKDFLLKLQ